MGPDSNQVSDAAASVGGTATEAPAVRERKISNINSIRVWEQEEEHHHHHKLGEKHFEKREEKVVVEEKRAARKVRKSAQFLSALAANMGAFALGTVMAWSATALPSLRSGGKVGKGEEAWIGSIVTLSAAAACPLAAYAMTAFGRRRAMLWLTLPSVAGWLTIAFAELLPLPTVWAVIGGRAVTGLAAGSFSVIAPIYVAETSHPSLRGALASGFDLLLSCGMLFAYIVGLFTQWETQALAAACVPLIVHGLLMLVTESPVYLVECGRVAEAGEALKWLYGGAEGGGGDAGDLQGLQKSVEDSLSKPINFNRVVMKLSVLKPILICFTVMFFYTMCVYDAVIFYTVDIFKGAGGGLDPGESAVLLGVVQVVATLPAALLVDRYGRRLLLLTSELLLTISLLSLGLSFHPSTPTPPLLPLLSLTTFLIAYSIGLGPLSLVLLSELVPSHLKGFVTSTALVIRWLLGFAVTNCFETMETALGADYTWWMFAAVCGVGFVWVWVCVPETRGRSLEEIQVGFRSGVKKRGEIVGEGK